MRSTSIEDIYTLSPLQQGMLFHIASQPHSQLYLDQTTCAVRGDLDLEAFRRAWQEVVDRHPALRTAFLWEGLSKPVQVVHASAELPFEVLDWRGSSPKVQKAQLEAFLRQDRRESFDLTQAPLMRLYAIRVADQEHRLLWTVSHLVVDAWCSGIIIAEVLERYEAHRTGREPAVPPLFRFRDYVAWLKKKDLAEAERYWRSYLSGYGQPVPLGREERSDSWPGLAAGHRHEHASLSPVHTATLRELGRRHQLTLNTLVQGAWALTLAFNGQAYDVVFGSAVSGRPPELPGADQTVGLFINTLPLRTAIDENLLLVSWLARLQDEQLEMREHEHTPLSRVQGWSELHAGDPLFESILVFLNTADPIRHNAASLEIADLRHVGRPHYPLNVNVTPGESLEIEMIYDVQRFRAVEIRNILDQFSVVLRALPFRFESNVGHCLDLLQDREHGRRAEERRKRRDSNTDRLRITRPVAIKLGS